MKYYPFVCILALLFWAITVGATNINVVNPSPTDAEIEETDEDESEAAGMEYFDDDADMPFVPQILGEDEYKTRLAKLPNVINLPYNSIVRNWIILYTGRKIKDKAEEILGLSEYYFPIFESILDLYGLPLEFKYLPVIESALKPYAVSRAGAVGLWQFMYGTAKRYDVVMTTTVDERRDPIVATHAAARHLKDLYDEFHDWTLVIAAYNCGSGNVRKAMRRSGKSDFWGIYNYLPRETRGYVPAFIGASYMMNYYKEHNFTPQKINFDAYYRYDTVKINRWVHFDQIQALTGIPVATLRDLNPQYRRDIIPGNEKPYALKIPILYISQYIDSEDDIPSYKSDVYNPVLMTAPAMPAYSSYYAATPPAGSTRITHTVRSGETLGTIAALYKVRVGDLRAWNRIRGNTIYAGKKISIYKKSRQQAQSKGGSSEAGKLISQSGHLCYQVRNGDTLWNISQRYKYLGVNMETIKSLNQIDEASRLSAGQVLKIKKI
jgi:membrane-bound lytic murein transglycosylase D